MKTEYVKLSTDGRFYAVTVDEKEMQVGNSIADAFAKDVSLKFNNLRVIGGNYRSCGLTLLKSNAYLWTIRLQTLPMFTHFNMEGKVHVPVFDNKDAPLMTLNWDVPKDMELLLGIQGQDYGIQHMFTETYFVAVDANRQLYTTPTANVFDDGRLCHGMTNVPQFESGWLMVQHVLDTFDKSQWSDHLYRDNADANRRANTKNMFRFEAVNSGFQQQPSVGKWQDLSRKLGNEFLQQNLIFGLK